MHLLMQYSDTSAHGRNAGREHMNKYGVPSMLDQHSLILGLALHFVPYLAKKDSLAASVCLAGVVLSEPVNLPCALQPRDPR